MEEMDEIRKVRLANWRREFELAFSLHDNSMTAVFFGS
jgi:hypothetical protein